MSRHRLVMLIVTVCLDACADVALAADTPSASPISATIVASLAIGFSAIVAALIVMHRARRRLRQAENEVAESLRENERRYRAIVEDQSELICRWRPDGFHTYANPAYCRSFGLSAEEMLKTKVLDLIPEEDHAQAKRHWASLTPARPAGTHQHRVVAEEGRVRLQEWTDRAIFDADGNVVAYQSVGRDITNRQEAEDRLRESEARFRSLSESAPIGIFRADADGMTNFVNAHLLKISGLTQEESLGQGWMRVVHPEDRADVHADILQSRSEHRSFQREFRIITTLKEVRWIRVRTVWIEGSPAEQVGTVEDITDQKRAIEITKIQRDLAADLGNAVHLGEALDLVLAALFRVSGCDAGAVHLIDGDSGDAHILHSKGLSQAYLSEFFHQPASSPLARLIAQGAVVSGPACENLFDSDLREREGLRWAAFVPIEFKGSNIGAIVVASHDIAHVPEGDVAVFESIAAQIGGAIGRIRAIAELRAERDHSTRIIEGSPAIVCGISPDGTTLFVNPACERVTGYSKGEIVGCNWWDTFYPGDERAQVPPLLERIRAGNVRDYEMRLTCRDGSDRIISWNSITRTDDSGDMIEIIGFCDDVTERRRAEDELRKFKTVADKTPHGQAIVALDGTLLYVNHAWASMHGFTPEELIGCHLNIFHSEGQMPRVDELNEKLVREGSYAAQEVWHIRRDGTPFPTLMDATVITDETGEARYLSGMASDISRIKEYDASLQRLAFMLNSINDAVYLTDGDNRVTYWNAAAEDIFGYKAEEVLGRSPSILYHPHEIESLDDCIRTGLAEDGFWADEMRFCTKDGSEITCETFCAPVRDERQDWISTVTVHRDITARKNTEAERAEYRAQLYHRQKLEAVGTLAAGIAHDFNNLLSAIFGHTHLAKSLLNSDDPALRSLEMVTQTAQQARGVISALLTFTRKSVALKQRMDIVKSLADSVRLLRRLLPGSVEIVENLPDTPLIVNGDDAQLKQIWMNLAVNARDAMLAGGTLALEVATVDDPAEWAKAVPELHGIDGPFVRVRVSDTGCGMDEDVLARVFEPFFTTKPRSEGTGLGMSVVLGIAEDHGGAVRIESEKDKGTVVSVFLPLCRLPAQLGPPQPEPKTIVQRKAAILCEDDSQIRSILTSSLRNSGYEVHAATDFDSTLSLYSRYAADVSVLVLNFDHPKLDKADLLSKIRDMASDVPLVIITSNRNWRPASGLGNHERILRMPYQVEDLLGTLNEVLEHAQTVRGGQP